MQLRDAFLKFRADPVLFVRHLIGAEPREHQDELMSAVAVGHRRVSMRSGRRVGKTTALVWLSMWWEMCFPDAKTIVTAPASAQLKDAYIPEFKKWSQRLPDDIRPCWNLLSERFEFRVDEAQGFENFITIRTARADSPESLHGINAPHSLVLMDEASGIADDHFQAVSGSLGAEHASLVLTSNPSRQSGFFYETHHALKDRWYTMHVNSEDVNAVSRDWIEDMRLFYGVESDGYRVHVLGEFPTGEANVVIPIDLIDAAIEREVGEEWQPDDIVWGVDPARFGDDKTALCKRRGRVVPEPVRLFSQFDLMEITGFVKSAWDETPPHERPFEIMVESNGPGAGVADRLRELGLPARDVNVSELSPFKGGNYYRLRDELWFQGRQWLAAMDSSLPRDSVLATELASVTYGYASDGKLKVASKDELKRLGLKSPNAADSFILTFAGSAAVALHGRRPRTRPRKRRIRGIV